MLFIPPSRLANDDNVDEVVVEVVFDDVFDDEVVEVVLLLDDELFETDEAAAAAAAAASRNIFIDGKLLAIIDGLKPKLENCDAVLEKFDDPDFELAVLNAFA